MIALGQTRRQVIVVSAAPSPLHSMESNCRDLRPEPSEHEWKSPLHFLFFLCCELNPMPTTVGSRIGGIGDRTLWGQGWRRLHGTKRAMGSLNPPIAVRSTVAVIEPIRR